MCVSLIVRAGAELGHDSTGLAHSSSVSYLVTLGDFPSLFEAQFLFDKVG